LLTSYHVFFSSRRRHTRSKRDWSSDVCSSDLHTPDLTAYMNDIDLWIGADGGVLTLIKQGITLDYAVGDFDSIDISDKKKINNRSEERRVGKESKRQE